jgi:penicillin amidase
VVAGAVAIVGAAPDVAAGAEAGPGAVRIVRDHYGVPHVYADSVFGLFFGYGRSIAEDRLFQIEMTRRSTQGLVAQVLGAGFVNYDAGVRRAFLPESIERQLAGLSTDDRAVFDGYAAGINAWIDEVEARPDELLPRQFVDFDFRPARWTAYDVAMIFVGTMANRYGDFNTELENARILAALRARHGAETAARIFDALLPRWQSRAPTTIAGEDWPADRSRAADRPSAALPAAAHAAVHAFQPRWQSGFSNCIALGRSRTTGAASILVNGPQFGWFVPAYVYSIGLHGAGFDMVGNTPFGYPVLLFGHNSRIAWGSTWGAGDVVDVYEERLKDNDSNQYWHAGNWRAFATRTETIAVRGAVPVEVTVRRSVHGPVVAEDPEAGIAWARHRAWDGLELQTLLAWLHSGRALNYREWIARAGDSAQSINWYYADVDGNVGYAYTGHYPERVADHDNRLPATGEGAREWRGRQPFATNPQVFNPRSGYVANWNNKPANGVLNPDVFWQSWSGADRIDYLHDAVAARQRFTPDEAWSLIESSSYADINAPYFRDWFSRIAQRDDGENPVRSLARLLLQWDQHSRDRDGDGFYDLPQTLIFQTFLGELNELVLKDDLGDAYPFFAATGYPQPGAPTDAGLDIQTGTKAVIAALSGEGGYDFLNGRKAVDVVAAALQTTGARLAAAHGDDPGAWRLPVAPRPFSSENFMGVPQAGANEALTAPVEQNRGTANDMIAMTPGNIIGWEVVPPGQSGFISPSGERSPHYADQFELYQSFGRKRMWFYPGDVEANKASEVTVVPGPAPARQK